jgi:DNA-directed DNA polymerase III PolC
MTDIKIPKKFVGLHSHSTLSVGDAIGLPGDHIDFAIENGMDALALTDHGNMNGFSHQYFHWKKLKDKGVKFKTIPGIEAYYINSLDEWKLLYEENKRKKQEEKELKKSKKSADEELDDIGDDLVSTKQELDELTEGGTVVEDENASKQQKWQDPLKQRNHLVLLPKNSEGFKSLFEMTSLSYIDGYYLYPRFDLRMLKKYSKGNIVATTACLAGLPAKNIFKYQTEPDWNDWKPNKENFEAIQKDLKDMVEAFQDALGKENYYLELQFNKLNPQHLLNQHLIECSKRTGAPLIVTCDAHYSRPEHWKEREIYKMMAWSSKTKDGSLSKDNLPKKIEELKCELYPKNAEQVWKAYKETTEGKGWDFYDDQTVCDAIERTYTVAHDQIGQIDPDRSVKLPSIKRIVEKNKLTKLYSEFGQDSTEDQIAFKELKNKAIEGLVNFRKKSDNKEYIERLKYELEVVRDLNFAKYFLTYAKIMEIVSTHMLLGNARGSGGGSLLAYVLNITQMDPIKHGLLFERFLARNKKGFPDIDSDFADRDKAVKLLVEYFGEENVIPVSNFNQLQLRSLIKDVARLEGIPFDQINLYTREIENEAKNEAKKTSGFDAQQWVLTFDEAEQNSPTFRKLMKEYPDFEATIKVLFKQMRNVSRHAGGVIITDNTIQNMPIIKSGGVLQTPWPEGLNFRHLEGFGLLKFDILGLGTLRMFEDCIRKILKKEGKKYVSFEMINKFFYDKLHPDNNEMDDIDVYKNVYWDGRFAGIFQFVNPPAQKFVQEMKPTSILDIATATSIFRPGPLGIGADKMYLENRSDTKHIRYKHPLLEDVLSSTCGLIVFQEQLQLIYHKLAGVPLEDTDNVRKAFTKKDISNREASEKARQKLREEFADGCLSANNIAKEISYSIFDEMEKFVSYSFNKSHAVAYAITSYQTAWLMNYYPEEWITTYVDYSTTEKGKASGKEDPKAIAIQEARALGYKLSKPDINLCEETFSVKDKNKLIPSFASLKHCGKAVVEELKRNRPYNTVQELLFDPVSGEWRHSKFNKRALATLIKTQAFESMNLVGEDLMFKNYKQLHYVLVDKADELKRASVRKKNKNHLELMEQFIQEAQSIDDWTVQEKLEFSKELQGNIDISMIIVPEIKTFLDSNGVSSIQDWEEKGQICWAIVKSAKEATTKTKRKYLRVQMLDEGGLEHGCFIWNFNSKNPIPKENTLIVAKFDKSDFGFSTNYGSLEEIKLRN